jgi:hypothetical protein
MGTHQFGELRTAGVAVAPARSPWASHRCAPILGATPPTRSVRSPRYVNAITEVS